MKEKILALLVHQNSPTLTALKAALEHQGLRVLQAETHAHAQRLLDGLNPVPLVFTDIQLPDGTWSDILALAEKATQPVNVIVVARVVDTRFYVEAIENGAFDFIAPPFMTPDLEYVVHSALSNVTSRRAAKLPTPERENGLLLGVLKSTRSAAQA